MLAATRKSWRKVPRLVLALWLGSLPAALAESHADDKAAAEALFDQGIELLKSGAYEKACERLEASQRIDPGIGTLLYLGECYEKSGKTASAWATFREAASAAAAAGQAERAKIGAQRAERLAPQLLYLELEPDPELETLAGVEILRAGRPIAAGLWDAPIPVDPGEHVLEVRAPGYEPYRTTVTLQGAGTTESIRLPMLLPSSTNDAAALGGAGDSAPSDGNFQRTSGLVIAGLGLLSGGVGSYFGLRAISKNQKAEESCAGSSCTTEAGVDLTQEALSAARISNVAFVAGGALLAGGLVLYFTAPRRLETARLEVAPTWGGAQLQLGGSF